MQDTTNCPTVTLGEAVQLALIHFEAGQTPMWLGPPGIGKTAAAAQLAKLCAEKWQKTFGFFPLEMGLSVSEEIGGVPTRDAKTSSLIRLPLGPIAAASDSAGLLALDEFTRCNAEKQGAAMTGVNERRFGDAMLHPDTRIIIMGNGLDSGGTHQILDAMTNRIAIYNVAADLVETCNHYRNMTETGTLKELLVDFAITAEQRPGLIALSPPAGSQDSARLWSSPRACEKGLRSLAKAIDGGLDDKLLYKIFCAHVGTESATMYFTVRRLRDKLPTVSEIKQNPRQAKLPVDSEANVAALGLIAMVLETDPDAGWIYTGRLQMPEIKAAIGRAGLKKTPTDPEAKKVWQSITGNAIARMNQAR